MEMLIQEKYIDGVSVKRSVDGSTEISLLCPRITLRGLEKVPLQKPCLTQWAGFYSPQILFDWIVPKGLLLEYLQENSLMQKIANLSKGIVEIIK